jgi:hypothetical protein
VKQLSVSDQIEREAIIQLAMNRAN